MDIKLGDKIAYIKYDTRDYCTPLIVDWGYVFYNDDEKIGCAKPKYSPQYIKHDSPTEKYFIVDDNTKLNMIEVINNEICRFRQDIKTLTTNEKDELVKEEFNKIKQQIIKTAENMIKSDETDFINKLKAICDLKKKLFSIKVSDLDNVHKANGAIKYKIKKLDDLVIKISEIKFE